MRFNLSFLLFLSLSGCGILGEKSMPAGSAQSMPETGCLNQSKDLVRRYLDGKITATEWNGAFSCVNQSLRYFTTFVRGSASNAYTASDLYNLLKDFLLTNHSVHPELMNSALQLKSALFGGSSAEFTKSEIDLLLTSITRLQEITASLIPALEIRSKPSASEAELLELASAFQKAGDDLAAFSESLPTGPLSSQVLQLLITELTDSLDLPTLDGLNHKFFLAKWLLFNTRPDAFESSDWPDLLRFTLGSSGIALAMKTAVKNGNDGQSVSHRLLNDPAFRRVMHSLLLQAKPWIDRAIQSHQGSIPFPLLDHLVDAIPETYLQEIPSRAWKGSLRPLIRNLLMSKSKTGLDQASVNSLFHFLSEWNRDLELLDQYYEKTGMNPDSVPPSTQSASFATFLESLQVPEDHARFESMTKKVLAVRPLFQERAGPEGAVWNIHYGPGNGYSRHQHLLVLTLDRIGRHLLQTYAGGRTVFSEKDLSSLARDFSDLLYSARIVDTSVPGFAGKRLREMDLFTDASDGNLEGSLQEFIDYALILISSGNLTSRMKTEIGQACDQGLGEDPMGWTLAPSVCFRSQFHDRLPHWIEQDFPRLSAYWQTLSPEEQRKGMMWLEHAARRNGHSEEPFGKADSGAMAVILYYTESLFNRFDLDSNEGLSRTEVNSAYPVFRELIRKTASEKGLNTSSDFLLKGIYTYIVRYEEMPLQPANAGNAAKLALWMAKYSFPSTDYHTDRHGIFNIVCQIASPENPSQSTPNAVVCAP